LKPSASSASNAVSNEILFSIPVGEGGIHYAGGGPEQMLWGPSALAVALDGSFWIADTADDHILHYNLTGKLLDKIAIGDWVIGAGDLEVTSQEVWVLDVASIPPKVVRLSLSGKLLNRYELPKGNYLEDGLIGIAIGGEGDLLIEKGGGAVFQLVSSSGTLEYKTSGTYTSQRSGYSTHLRDQSRLLYNRCKSDPRGGAKRNYRFEHPCKQCGQRFLCRGDGSDYATGYSGG
jgi:hypothetical protein